MAYAQNFALNFGPGYESLTLNGALYDTGGTISGSTITSGFVNLGHGLYSYIHSAIPDNFRGSFKVWAPADANVGSIGLSVNPEEAENVADILAYVQNILSLQQAGSSSSGSSGSVDSPTASEPTGSYLVEPSSFRMITAAELVAELRELVAEPALKETMAQRAVRAALNEEDHKPVVLLTFTQTFTDDACDYPAPCSGLDVVAIDVRYDDDCDDCYSRTDYTVARNRIHLPLPLDGYGRITVALPNRFVSDQHTIAMAAETETTGLWAIYIEGQPELPGSGIIRVCGDAWVYAYKSGVTFATAQRSSATPFDSDDGVDGLGRPLPDGNHTVLYAQRIANCGRLADKDIADLLPGSVIEWPILYHNGTHKEYLLAMAVAKTYTYLINSSRSDRDVSRFATLQQHWQTETQRLMSKLPKLAAAKVRRTRNPDAFNSTFSLRSGWARTFDGRFTRVRSLW